MDPESNGDYSGNVLETLREIPKRLEDGDSSYGDSSELDTAEESNLLEEEAREGIHKDDLFSLLGNSRRRAVLRYMMESDSELFTLGDISENVAAYQQGVSVDALDSDERKRVYVALYQTHLDKLDEHGMLNYNKDRGLIQPDENLEIAAHYLEDELNAEKQRICSEDLQEGFISEILGRF